MTKIIESQYPTKCTDCGKEIKEGEKIEWTPSEDKNRKSIVRCRKCCKKLDKTIPWCKEKNVRCGIQLSVYDECAYCKH